MPASAIGADPKQSQIDAIGQQAEEALFESAVETLKNDVNNRLIKDQLSQVKSDVQNLSY